MSGRMARNKGAGGERELAALLTDALGFVVQRKLGQARDGGDDIQVGKFRIEVKRHERLQIRQWCEQVEQACAPGDVPVVAFRQNGQPWRAVVPLDVIILLMREYHVTGN
jgi:Holliday junction resolvase